MGATNSGFLDRARVEAARSGPDPWVFVRELLQNARDAGARNVVWRTGSDAGLERVSCLDDGAGMSFEHARRFLLTLYASSKRGRGAAGRFGVGFWTILRFEPSRVVIRSWPRRGVAWQLGFRGDLGDAERSTPPVRSGSGTQIVLERPHGRAPLGRAVAEAVASHARGLRGPGSRHRVAVTVDGVRCDRDLGLPAPSARFRRGDVEGVVGLGRHPRVELFALGLRVRTASALSELDAADGSLARPLPPPGDRLAPRAQLEDPGLEPLLTRQDVRADRRLSRLVRRAQRELDRLVERQLERDHPRGLAERLREDAPLAGFLAALGVSAAVVAAATLWWPPNRAPARRAAPSLAAPPVATSSSLVPLQDLEAAYPGPRDGTGAIHALDLRYAPPDARLHVALFARARPDTPVPDPGPAGPPEAWACGASGVAIDVAVDAPDRALPLPLPTGHRLDTRSLRWQGRAASAFRAADGWPRVRLGGTGRLRYRTCPGPAAGATPPSETIEALPVELREAAHGLRAIPAEARAAAAERWVRERVRYARAPGGPTSAGPGVGFVERALETGRGDCDVQNGLLVLLLRAAGTPARLAVGHLGREGRLDPRLHAWAEYLDGSGRWRVADASRGSAPLTAPESLDVPATSASGRGDPRAPLGFAVAGVVAGGVAAVAVVLAGWLAWRSRTRRSWHLDPRPAVLRLLRGALEHPEAFRGSAAVFERRLLPSHAARPVSLGHAWCAAARGRLACAADPGDWSRHALHAGLVVLDARAEASSLVARALGAVDLDAWREWSAASSGSPLLERTQSALGRRGLPVWLRRSPTTPPGPCLDLRSRGAHRLSGPGFLLVALEDRAGWLAEAEAAWARAPAAATLAVADRITEWVGSAPERRRRLLRPLAVEALVERAR